MERPVDNEVYILRLYLSFILGHNLTKYALKYKLYLPVDVFSKEVKSAQKHCEIKPGQKEGPAKKVSLHSNACIIY
jgi:hypothetical protein